MSFIFAPAIAIMARLRYPQKFMLIGAFALLAIGYLFASLTLQLRAGIAASRAELVGIEVVRPEIAALQKLQQHRGMTSGALGGEDALKSQVAGKQAEIADALKTADAAIARHGAALRITEDWRGIQGDWERLARDWSTLSVADNLKRHNDLIEKLMAMVILATETSGLILDPDLDSYYLMDTATGKLPDLTERMGRIRAAGTAVLAKKELGEDGKVDFSTRLGILEKIMADTRHNLSRAALANPAIKPQLDDLSSSLGGAFDSVARNVRDEIVSARFGVAATTYFTQVTKAIDIAYHQLGETLFPSLVRLIEARIANLERTFMLSAGIAVLTILGFAWMATGAYLAIIRGVGELSAGAEVIAAGDLTARVSYPGRDELREVADRFNGMTETFNDLIGRIQYGAEEVAGASATLASAAEQVSRSSAQQSDSAANMAAAVEQMTVSVTEVTRHAHDAHDLSVASGKQATHGSDVVGKTVREMDVIAASVTDSAHTIEELGERSATISTIVNVIKEIADQTNLLALNAAIEAARAGETGRGFAVVADEVRKLAERTGKATQEITGMVAAIQDGTGRAVVEMHDGEARVRHGVELAKEAGEAIEEINQATQQVVHVVGDISLALKEQSAASTQIARNVESIAQMAEQNNAAATQTAATAHEMQRLAQSLQADVGRFRVR